ncbi:H(+)-transporting V1 sector ATPase subunit H [Coemansia sp. RSA 1822]|nr:H(+)-transporting V1 sector ATPase subunit H [Coemansia sp. RSA 638]KAJ2544282.1 H(+)-transporting V1 sector ATPase subunit H [Coemansia sp. RSA 1853]KAJ2564375.1 H(+)-transporting V1 sector ATPase subunit H [Coemansia sp. RSA 1822]
MATNVPAAMVSNQFFDEFTAKVRVKPIPWEGYSRAGLISSDELHQLKDFQKQLVQLVESSENSVSLATHVPLLVLLTEKLSSVDALQYLLVVLDELAERDVESVRALANDMDNVSRALFRCMDKKDDYLGLKACKILTGIAVTCNVEAAFGRMFAYLEKSMRSELTSVVDVALQVVQSALRVPRARSILYNEAGCLAQMIDVLKRTVSGTKTGAGRGVVAVSQTQYEVVFCLWLLTFERHVAVTIDRKYDVVSTMVEIARSAVKEKVVRIIVATWANMAQHSVNVPGLLVARVPACLETLRVGRNFNDEDLKQTLTDLTDTMAEHTGVMTSWDEYVNQLKSGKLEWSGWHRSEQFWKIHVAKMDENDHRIVRLLARVLAAPESTDTSVAVACHDLSQYVKYNPEGKKFVAKVGAKQRVMTLMTEGATAEIKYEALMCVQQIMLNAWRN